MNIRALGVALLMPLLVLAAPAPAGAQMPGAGPTIPLPLVVPLKKIPVGSWSEYVVDDGQHKISMRVALVARTATAVEVESQIKGGPFKGVERTVVRMSLPIDE